MSKKNASPSAKQLFLFLLHEGGWWTVKELAGAMAEQTAAQRRLIGNTLRHLVDGGSVIKRAAETRAIECMEFGVTATCAVPAGITLEELQP